MSERNRPSVTVKELKRLLDQYPDDLEVMLTTSSHDYWGTSLALSIGGGERQSVIWSEYHRTFSLPRNPEREQDDEASVSEEIREVLLLR